MKRSPERPADAQAEAISLDALGEAFARAMGRMGPDEESLPDDGANASDHATPGSRNPTAFDDAAADEASDVEVADDDLSNDAGGEADDDAPVTPGAILEAMLFVGNDDGHPLSAEQAAEPMRGVEPREIPDLVAELNRRYRIDGCPYEVTSERGGYRMVLRREYRRLRDRFHGRVREARLSQAAVDVLAIAAYRQPLSGEQVSRLRGRPSGHLLNQLVRRDLLRIERKVIEPDEGKKRRVTLYHTTGRFLDLFGMESLDDLPRSDELDR